MMKFRVHHILCTQLYRGLGYSGPFCENMTEKVTLLRENPKTELLLVTEPDAICANCPNLVDDTFCSNGNNNVTEKDRLLLPVLQLEEGRHYTYEELLLHAKEHLTRVQFEESCKNCGWYREGICRYDDFRF